MAKHSSDITRRRFVQAAGALAGVAAIGGWSPARAQAGGRIVLGTWGGDYSKLLSKNIDTPLMVPKKYEVVHDIGGDPERRAKMRAEARLPRGTSDLQGLSAAQMYEMNDAGLCLPNEEVGICIMWKARAVQWQKAGAKVETVAPKEGVPLYISGFVIPKNAPNKEGAHVWLNEMLEPSAQESFAEDMGYNASVINAKIPAETEKRIS